MKYELMAYELLLLKINLLTNRSGNETGNAVFIVTSAFLQSFEIAVADVSKNVYKYMLAYRCNTFFGVP